MSKTNKKMTTNITPGILNWKRCDKCESLFSSSLPKRTTCVRCRPINRKELFNLQNYQQDVDAVVAGAAVR